MRNRKKGNGLVVLILIGLLGVAVVGGILLTQGGTGKAVGKPVKPTIEGTR
ncbi:MAG: hypothetical protein KDB90_14955 [Planctomycetes bacterium]|nr:hypothetical protein [Planctomycetota bacterium]